MTSARLPSWRPRVATAALLALALLVGCGGSCQPPPPAPPPRPPAAATEHPACVISADCPAGQHCDLGECTQDCNVDAPCGSGLACSPRARCLPPMMRDLEPPPTATHRGEVFASPSHVQLRADDRVMRVQLRSTGTEPVRYRVEINAPHLAIDAPRGSFTGSTELAFRVDPTTVRQRGADGAVRIVTSLGEVVVTAPIRAGLSGYYQGTMEYDQAPLPLGQAALAVEMLESDGAVRVRVDPEASLLFPPVAAVGAPGGVAPTTGTGRFTPADGLLDVTLTQRVGATFGGERNYFARPVVRQVRLLLRPGTLPGTLQGTFSEVVSGLFARPATAGGRVTLGFVPGRAVDDFAAAPPAPPPTNPITSLYLYPRDVFAWTGNGGLVCRDIARAGCALIADGARRTACEADPGSTAEELIAALTAPLLSGVGAGITGTERYTALADACRASFALTSDAGYASSPARGCGMIAPLACTLEIAQSRSARDALANGRAFVEGASGLLASSLLVAKDEIVAGLAASFTTSAQAERLRYEQAFATLRPVGRWMLQPAVVEYLRAMPADAARGRMAAPGDRLVPDTFPAARALAEYIATLSVLDGELARADAAARAGEQRAVARRTQERSVLTYLEAVTVAEMVRAWGEVPDAVAARFIGVLGPLDRAHSAVRQGANALGVPRGFVPFVYRPEDVGHGPTNFEQMLTIAQRAVETEALAEADYRDNHRQFEANAEAIRSEIRQIRSQFDQVLTELCGATFNPNAAAIDAEWARCGASTGQIALQAAQVEQAAGQVRAMMGRVQARAQQIAVSARTLMEIRGLREDNLRFQLETGQMINVLTAVQGGLSVVTRFLQTASNAQLWNLGLPVAMAAVVAVLEGISVGIESTKNDLRLAQTARALATDLEVEQLRGLESLQREWIEFQQLAIEAAETSHALIVAQIALANARARAHSVYEERRRWLDEAGDSPLRDPTYRLVRDRSALAVVSARAVAQRQLSLAANALMYELNASVPNVDGAVLNATNASRMRALVSCMDAIHVEHRTAFGSPQPYVTTVSVRRLLGITGPRADSVTGEMLSEGQQFRLRLLRNQNLDGRGGVGLEFATTLQPNNGLWSSDVCADRIVSVEAQLVGDSLGDNDAQVNLLLDGLSVMRACDSDALTEWSLGQTRADASTAVAVLQAGVNSFGSAPPNRSLFGQSVARPTWRLLIPGAAGAPANADVDLTHVDDVVLRVTHQALPRRRGATSIDFSCLSR